MTAPYTLEHPETKRMSRMSVFIWGVFVGALAMLIGLAILDAVTQPAMPAYHTHRSL